VAIGNIRVMAALQVKRIPQPRHNRISLPHHLEATMSVCTGQTEVKIEWDVSGELAASSDADSSDMDSDLYITVVSCSTFYRVPCALAVRHHKRSILKVRAKCAQ
jgi:hypothetical protein